MAETEQPSPKLLAEIDLLAAQAEHFRAQAKSIPTHWRHHPALWAAVATVIVGVAGYVATFRSEAYRDLVALKDEQLKSANAELPKLQTEITNRKGELLAAESKAKVAQDQVAKVEQQLKDREAAIAAANQRLTEMSGKLRLAQVEVQVRRREVDRLTARTGELEGKLVSTEGRLTTLANALQANEARLKSIGGSVATDARTEEYIRKLFVVEANEPELERYRKFAGYVVGRINRDLQTEIQAILAQR